MATIKGFQIDRRVGIALDALSPGQQAVLKPVLQDRESFDARAKRPGATERLSASRPLYLMRVGREMRIIYSVQGEDIIVQDIMRQATMDRLVTKRAGKSRTAKKPHEGSSVKEDEASEVHKV